MALETTFILAQLALTFLATGVSVLVAVLLIEVVAALPGTQRSGSDPPLGLCSYVVVIPAHNEVGTIETTLASVFRELDGRGEVLVVADNCTDETFAVSASCGAKVITRTDPLRRGKGYALDFAVQYLAAAPPDIVLVLDADCTPAPGAIGRLVANSHWLQQPVQSRYEIVRPAHCIDRNAGVGLLAWRVKNSLRPTGLANLGLPCLLTGTGMALPWSALAKCNLSTGHLVEDMILGLELTAAGHPPCFMPDILVQSTLPPSVEGRNSQRVRWETGHLQVLTRLVPWYLLTGLRQGNLKLLALALHTAVPPLALLALLLGCITGSSALLALVGGSIVPLLLMIVAGLGALATLLLVWHAVGRDLLSCKELLLIPGYVFSKLSLYARALSGQHVPWVRTKRD